jgi:hypothetical protein
MNAPHVPKVISNWMKYNSFLKKQDALLADIFLHYQGKKVNYEYERVLAGLLHRYALNFRAIYKCWDLFLNDSKIKFPIYTLLRPLLADFLLMLYLLENFKFLVPTDAKDDRDQWKVNADDFLKRYEIYRPPSFNVLIPSCKRK